MSAWLKSIGVTGDPLPPDWYVTRADALRRTQFIDQFALGIADVDRVLASVGAGVRRIHQQQERCNQHGSFHSSIFA